MRGKRIDLARVRLAMAALRRLARENPGLVGRSGPENVAGWVQTIAEDEMAGTKLTAFRLDEELLERLDRHAKRMTGATPGMKFTRADALRVLLTTALDAAEAKDGIEGRGKRR